MNKTIGIDARFLGPQGSGLGRYVGKLLENLEVLDDENSYVVFLREENFDLFDPRKPNFRKVKADAYWYTLKEQLTLPNIFGREKLDLLHVPHFNIPIFYKGKMVVTVHDLIKSEFTGISSTTRNPLIYWLKHFIYETVIRVAVKRATFILTPSNYVKEQLVSRFNLGEEKVKVTYEGVPDSLELGTRNSEILKKLKLEKPYFLYVGNAYPYKNLEILLKALKTLPKEEKLVLVCPRDTFTERLKSSISKLGLEDRVVLSGFVEDKDLWVLYQEAQAFVFPSLSEGFGLPTLEAMSQGVPVVCSDIPVLKEVCHQAALYFDPQDENDLAEKLKNISEDKRLRSDLINLGKERIRFFSWRKMAEQTLAIYQSALKL